MTRAHWVELALLTLAAAALAAAVPLHAGMWAWSWDAINHHIYLGLIAQSPRWDLDLLAANSQGFQYPYLYWPVYWLSTSLLLPPVWLASLYLMVGPETAGQAMFQRVAACALAGSSIVVMAAVGTTSNDPMTAVPLLWAVALMAKEGAGDGRAAGAAALWGVSTAFKWSNGLAMPLLLFWWWQARRPNLTVRRGLLMAAGAMGGFTVAYLPWGLQLWRVKGNPFYPLFGSLFGA